MNTQQYYLLLRTTVNFDAVGSFVFFIACLVAGFHEISNHFFNFLWDASERIPELSRTKCVQLLRELLESVVLQSNSNHGGSDE